MPEMSWKRFEGWPKSTRSDVRCLIVRFLCDWKHFSRASSILTQKSEQKDNKMWFCPQIGDTADTLNLPLRWENEKRFGLRGTMGYLVSMIMSLIWMFILGGAFTHRWTTGEMFPCRSWSSTLTAYHQESSNVRMVSSNHLFEKTIKHLPQQRPEQVFLP
jgi:hypothetical protein